MLLQEAIQNLKEEQGLIKKLLPSNTEHDTDYFLEKPPSLEMLIGIVRGYELAIQTLITFDLKEHLNTYKKTA